MLQSLEPGSRVGIIRLRSLGDCVLSTPAISLLKAVRPDLEIGVAVEARFAGVFDGHPAVSKIIEPRSRAFRAFSPDLCLNFHGGTRSARLTALSGATHRAGLNIFKPQWIYNVPIPTAQEILGLDRRVHTAEHMASAVFYLGVPITEIPRASLPVTDGPAANAPSVPYAVIHPFAATPEKTWPANNFLELARNIRRSVGLEPVFICAAGEDISRFQAFPTIAGAPLSEVIRLVRGASLFIGNDSGPAHLAAAFGVPELIFFGPSDEEIWRPWRTQAEVLKASPIYSIETSAAILALQRLNVNQPRDGERP